MFTIGHSTRSLEELIALLKENDVRLLVDVRSFPGSNRYPQFNKENLEKSIPEAGIEYKHIKLLGGRRKTSKNSHNTIWRHPAFRGYADYMETDDFKQGIADLLTSGDEKHTCIMCSEALWWKCHRSMISDYLKAEGYKVLHIMGQGVIKEHPYTSAAIVENGNLRYYNSLFER